MSGDHYQFWSRLVGDANARRRCLAYRGVSADTFAQRLNELGDLALGRLLGAPMSRTDGAVTLLLADLPNQPLDQLARPLTDFVFTRRRVETLRRRSWTEGAVQEARQTVESLIASLCRLESEGEDSATPTLGSSPVLARLIGLRVVALGDYLDAVSHRLVVDQAALRRRFAFDVHSGIAAVSFPLSDFHNRAQSACVLTDGAGERLVYKPRSLETDAAAATIFESTNRIAGYQAIRVPESLTRGSYGYSDYVSTTGRAVQPESIEAAAWSLVVAMVLGMRDLHAENVDVQGASIVVLDTECLMLPSRRPVLPDYAYSGSGQMTELAERSVYGSLLSYAVITSKDGTPSDIAGIRGVAKHGKRFLASFAVAYRQVCANKAELRAAIKEVPNVVIRYVPRDTRHYGDVAQWLHRPALLRSEALRHLALDILFDGLPPDLSDTVVAAIIEHEATALDRLDIPTFHTCIDSSDLLLQSKPLLGMFDASAREMAYRRLEDLGEDDLRRQSCILASLLRDADRHATVLPADVPKFAPLAPSIEGTKAPAVSAVHIQEHIYSAALLFASEDLEPAWLVVDVDSSGTARGLRPSDASLYGGLAGAYLCCALGGDVGSLELPTGPFRERLFASLLRRFATPWLGAERTGAFDGITGVLYALTSTASAEKTSRHPLIQAVRQVDWVRILETEESDIVSGLAGIVCVLRCLTRCDLPIPRGIADRAAAVLAKRVLDGRLDAMAAHAGFAHGTLGVYFALAHTNGASRSVVASATAALGAQLQEMIGDGMLSGSLSWCRGLGGVLLCHDSIDVIHLLGRQALPRTLAALIEAEHDFSLCCGISGLTAALGSLQLTGSMYPQLYKCHTQARSREGALLGMNAVKPPALEQLGLMRGYAGPALSLAGHSVALTHVLSLS